MDQQFKLVKKLPEPSNTSNVPKKDRKTIPIVKDGQHFDDNVNDARERFDKEMSRVDTEMNKFCANLLTIYDLTSKDKDGLRMWDTLLKSPLITDDGQNKILRLKFDISQFKPDEVSVYTEIGHLVVHAKHEFKANNCVLIKEYHRNFILPTGIETEHITAKVSKERVLLVEIVMPLSLELKCIDRKDIAGYGGKLPDGSTKTPEEPIFELCFDFDLAAGPAEDSTDESTSGPPNLLKKKTNIKKKVLKILPKKHTLHIETDDPNNIEQ